MLGLFNACCGEIIPDYYNKVIINSSLKWGGRNAWTIPGVRTFKAVPISWIGNNDGYPTFSDPIVAASYFTSLFDDHIIAKYPPLDESGIQTINCRDYEFRVEHVVASREVWNGTYEVGNPYVNAWHYRGGNIYVIHKITTRKLVKEEGNDA